MSEKIKIVDCPRDAMQGLHDFIATNDKIDHLTKLLKVGFDTIDCGSFVSPKIIPQMADTAEVLQAVEHISSTTKLSVIVASEGGAKRALFHPNVDYLGFPFSISEEFQQHNTNKSRKEAFECVKNIKDLVERTDKDIIVYFSMAFGNPYGEQWDVELVKKWADKFANLGIKKINLSDTTSVANLEDVENLFSSLIKKYPKIEFGAHFHSEYTNWYPKVNTAFMNGCRKFDGAIKGFGGCPMAKSELIGNTPSEKLLTFCEKVGAEHGLDLMAFESAYNSAIQIMG